MITLHYKLGSPRTYLVKFNGTYYEYGGLLEGVDKAVETALSNGFPVEKEQELRVLLTERDENEDYYDDGASERQHFASYGLHLG